MYIETYQRLIALIEERGMRYQSNPEIQSVCMDIRGSAATYRVIATVDEECDLLQIFAYSPVNVPQGAIGAVCEAVVRANFGLRVGKFEMDMDHGDVRFHVSQILTQETEVTEFIIDRMIGTAISMIDMYLPAFLSIVYGNEIPAEAIRQVEIRGPGGHPPPDAEEPEPSEHGA